ncbi:MAG: hypothetical protein Q7S22_07770 [Candidatus Micrarchaeota archaeon]|nr:hypothetical protein [Candidatus Micrarchaeota archaeon]
MGNLNKLLAYLKELKVKPNVENFQDKLVIQKTACLLEMLGNDLGYSFSLYVRGPYSPGLTMDLYAHRADVNKCVTDYVPKENEKRQLNLISELSNNLEPSMLEIMATYMFLVKELNKDEKQAIKDLKKLKSFYSDGRIAIGISRAKQLFFKPTEKEMKDMLTEFKEIEDATISDGSEMRQ